MLALGKLPYSSDKNTQTFSQSLMENINL